MAYGFRRSVTVDKAKVPNTDRTNFTVEISGTYSYLKTVANGGKVEHASGYDVAFYSDAALTTQLKHEVERWIATTGEVLYWVKVPTVSTSVDTVFYMAYGDAGISTDQSAAVDSWDADYTMVLHLPNGTTLSANDSTTNANNATVNGATAITGKVGGGMASDGGTQTIYVPHHASLAPSAFTLETWFKGTEKIAFGGIIQKYDGLGYWLGFNATDGKPQLQLLTSGAPGYVEAKATVDCCDGVWHHLAAVWNGSTTARIYVDGAQSATGSIASTTASYGTPRIDIPGNDTQLYIIACEQDEIRLSSVERSADWIATDFNNQSDPASFYSVGSEVALGGTPFFPRPTLGMSQAVHRAAHW